MAYLKSITSGNFTASSTWGVGNSSTNAIAVTNVGFTNSALSLTYSTTWTDVGSTNIGVYCYLNAINTASGTLTVGIYNSSNTVMGSVTVNVTDLTGKIGRFVFFKFTSNATLLASNVYKVGVSTTVNGAVSLGRASATANDWTRIPITTTNAIPTASDILYITGDLTGAGTSTSQTVTMDSTSSTTTYGSALTIQDGGTLSYGVASSTNYYLKLGGSVTINVGGTFTMGTQASPIPSTSTAKLEFACTSANQYTLTNAGGTFTTYGATKTSFAKLGSALAAAATSATTDVSTGWLNGDQIVIAGTNRTNTGYEYLTLNGDAVGTTLTLSAGASFAHDTYPTIPAYCDVLNLTRNVQIFGQGSGQVGTFTTSVIINGGTNSFNYTSFYYMGSIASPVTNNGFISNLTVANSTLNVSNCAIWGATIYTNYVFYHASTQATSSLNLSNNVIFTGFAYVASNTAVTPSTTIFNNCVFCRSGFFTTRLYITLTNCSASNSGGAGFNFSDNAITTLNGSTLGTVNNLTSYCNANNGITISSYFNGTISNAICFRGSIGLATSGVAIQPFVITNSTFVGNTTTNLSINGSGQIYFDTITTNSQTGYATVNAIQFTGVDKVYIVNSSLGVTTPETNAITVVTTSTGSYTYSNNAMFYNTTFGSYGTILLAQNSTASKVNAYGVGSINHNGIANNNFNWQQFGNIILDSTIYNSASYSMRMIPISPGATVLWKMASYPIKMAINANDTATISVKVRKSPSIGGETIYNGSQPRLMLLSTPFLGYSTNTVLATASAAVGTWETLTANFTPTVTGVYEFYVDCDGTTGYVNVDDWSTNYVKDTTKMDYWFMGMPEININGIPKERSVGFVY